MLTPRVTREKQSLKRGRRRKRGSTNRVLDVEMGSFTSLVFGTNGGMGADCMQLLFQTPRREALRKE